jgi:RHS repeat-associated protein
MPAPRNLGLALTLSGILFLCALPVAAQDPAAGIAPFSTQLGDVYDKVDPATSRILISIPVFKRVGKSALSFSLTLNSHASLPLDPYQSNPLMADPTVRLSPSIPFSMQVAFSPPNAPWSLEDPMGGIHPFSGAGTGGGGLGWTYDRSGYSVVARHVVGTTAYYDFWDAHTGNLLTHTVLQSPINSQIVSAVTATDPDGATTTWNLGVTLVRNGYSFTGTNTFTDTLGTALTVTGPPINPFAPMTGYRQSATPDVYTYSDANGQPQTVTVNYQQYFLHIPDGWWTPVCTQYLKPTPGSNVYMPSSIVMPTGETFTLSYEPSTAPGGGVTGRLAGLGLPNGGSISYVYSGNGDAGPGANCDGTVPTLTRTVADAAGNKSVWTYTRWSTSELCGGPNIYLCNGGTTVTDPQLNDTLYGFISPFFPNAVPTLQTLKLVYQGSQASGTLLSADETCYNNTQPIRTHCYTTFDPNNPYNIVSTDVMHYPNDSYLYFDKINSPLPSRVTTGYNYIGHVGFVAKYDYGFNHNGQQLPPVSIEEVIGNNTCLNAVVTALDLPCEVALLGGWSGPTLTDTKYSYNATGHVTQISTLVSGTSYLTTNMSYNPNGTLASVTDVNGAVTYYNYAGCGGILQTSTVLPVGNMSTARTWDCNGGVVKSTVDVDGNVARNSYVSQAGIADPLWRVLSSTDPLGNSTIYKYAPASSNGPATSESSLTFLGSQSSVGTSTVDVLTTLDSLGRPYLTQARQAPTSQTFDTSVVGYDPMGRAASFGVPCAAGSSASCSSSVATMVFDGAHRVLNATDAGGGFVNFNYLRQSAYPYPPGDTVLTTVGPAPQGEGTSGKQEQLQYDALGRLTSVCEVTAAAGSGPCLQEGPGGATGYFTQYGYDAAGRLISVTQNAQNSSPQQRLFSYDAMGRVLTANEPESGLTQFFYDTAPSAPGAACSGTYNGDLVKRYDANGNTICYTYDALHRNTSITYAGPNANGSNKYFVYDSATVNGVALSNVVGRLAEAYTATCSTCTKITDLGFSYSARGELTDVYEATPNSGGYYHVTATYYANGVIRTLSGVPGQGTWVYGLDGEGRPSTLTQGAATIVGNTTYDNAGSTLKISYATGDSDSYQYDSVERMTQYSFSVGASQALAVGGMGWNKNGTLQTLAITDALNAQNSQSCSYLYDDLVRVASATCNSAQSGQPLWAQTFSYDPFGNISKSGNSSFQPQYSPTTNRITSLPGVTVTYDSNGNLTSDGSHTYMWDTENHPAQVGATQLTYDALGRVVEINGTTQVLYGPIGKIGTMNKNTVKSLLIPLPGGARMEYAAGSKYVHHSDWLGTARLITSFAGRTNAYDSAYAPFGENYAGLGTPDFDFTGQTQDTVQGAQQGLFDFLYRKYSPAQGRWISPDPAGVNAVDPSHPQTWNRYTYVSNNPLSNVDPLGLDDSGDGSDSCSGDGLGDFTCGLIYNADSSSWWDALVTWIGGPFNADPLGSSAGSDPLWIVTSTPSTVASGPAAGLNPATGECSSCDVEISADMVNNAKALAPAFSRGNDQVHGFMIAAGIQAGVAAAVVAGPAVIMNVGARAVGTYLALKGPADTVIGRYPDYLDTAREMGRNVLSVKEETYNFWASRGEWLTLNNAFLRAQQLRGGTFTLSNTPWLQGGTNFADELIYLESIGVGPEQWRYVPLRPSSLSSMAP